MTLDLSVITPVANLDPASSNYVQRLESGLYVARKIKAVLQREAMKLKEVAVEESKAYVDTFPHSPPDEEGNITFFNPDHFKLYKEFYAKREHQLIKDGAPIYGKYLGAENIVTEYAAAGCVLSSIAPMSNNYFDCAKIKIYATVGKKAYEILIIPSFISFFNASSVRQISQDEKERTIDALLRSEHPCNTFVAENPVRNIISSGFFSDLESKAKTLLVGMQTRKVGNSGSNLAN